MSETRTVRFETMRSNIGGNKYRLIVSIDYGRRACFVKFIGTHKQYESINAETVNEYSSHQNRS